jgi:tetratricopeptide (TPR) repeat protein
MKSIVLAAVCRPLTAIVLIAGLGACSSLPRKDRADYAQLLNAAEAEVTAGRIESALIRFDQAAKADPTRKEPWVRSAQLQFDAGNHGRAIVAAEEVLQRDPSDEVADSVLTVSGLRIAAESLQRLQGNGALASETARAEAEHLAATMRATMGGRILDPEPKSKIRATPRRRSASRRVPAASVSPEQKPPGANPFEVLGGG